jgi:Lumazine binding domain
MLLPSWSDLQTHRDLVVLGSNRRSALQVGTDWFSVYLIPETLRVTVFGLMQVGDHVNIEVDSQTQAVVDTVERILPEYMSRIPVGAN